MTDKIKVPPSSSEAEEALLGCIIEGSEREQEIAMAWVRDIDAFYVDDNKLVEKHEAQICADADNTY